MRRKRLVEYLESLHSEFKRKHEIAEGALVEINEKYCDREGFADASRDIYSVMVECFVSMELLCRIIRDVEAGEV